MTDDATDDMDEVVLAPAEAAALPARPIASAVLSASFRTCPIPSTAPETFAPISTDNSATASLLRALAIRSCVRRIRWVWCEGGWAMWRLAKC